MTLRFGVKSDFSIGKSLLTVDKIAKIANENSFEAVVVADDMTISAIPSLYTRLNKDVKTVFGVTLFVYEDSTCKPVKGAKPNPMFMLKAYAKNMNGIRSIFKLLTKANSEENFYYNARTNLEEVCALEDVVISTGDTFSLFSVDNWQNKLEKLIDSLGQENVYIEVAPVPTPLFDRMNERAVEALKLTSCKPLVSFPARYENENQVASLNLSNAISKNMSISPERGSMLRVQTYKGYLLNLSTDKLKTHLNSFLERCYPKDVSVANLFTDFEKYQREIVETCKYHFTKQKPSLPKMADDEFATVCQECKKGWINRFTKPVLGYLPPADKIPEYKERLKHELTVLKNMNFSGYFLLVQDLVQWAKRNGIVVGSGRGSSGGSLVAYLMGITEIDPIRFNLFFERFINPERLDLPDADLDFQSERRGEVVEYLRTKYGLARVAGISNYGALGTASALRDTMRIFNYPNRLLSITKFIPKEHNASESLESARQDSGEIKEFAVNHPILWQHACDIEGVMRNLGRHAAGTVVAGDDLVNRAVVERQSGEAVVNWDKRIVEDMGLIKMDILGLSTLDILQIAKRYIKERTGKDINYLDLPLDDKETMELFSRGDTTGVFQFESPGIKKLLRDLAKNSTLTFDDVTVASALFRPGPLDSGMTEEYTKVKQGYREIFYEHPNMKAALESTLGVIVYQEQVMQIARDISGFSMGEADLLRRAMGKKDKAKMAKMKDKFIKGAYEKSDMSEEQATVLFEKIEKFAEYGFNKSHSVAYSIVSYWTAYLKAHYTAEFFAASLSIVGEDKYEEAVKSAKESGIRILPPRINESTDKFVVLDDTSILAPFSSVKFISENIARKLVELRNTHGKFASVEEFKNLASQKNSGINKRAIDNLEKVGGFCEIDPEALPFDSPERIKDQKELMGGLVAEVVRDNRVIAIVPTKRDELKKVMSEIAVCKNCDLKGKTHCMATLGSAKVRFVVVFDCPSIEEEKKGRFLTGKLGTIIKNAIVEAGLDPKEGYYTGLVKAKKNGKFLTDEETNACKSFIERELKIINPPVVICLGSESSYKINDGEKGTPAQAFYNPKLGRTVITSINPATVFFDASKLEILTETFKTAKKVLS